MSARSLELKRRLKQGATTYGGWLTVPHPMVGEIMAGAGFDWVIIDTEHGGFDNEGLMTTLVAFNGSLTVPIVRVPWNDAVRIKQILDSGADGVLVPMVNSPAEARAAVSACKYPPVGTRGFGPRRASGYGRKIDEYVRQADEGTIVMLQIEHVDAVAQIEEILDVPGIDVICMGPTDLSGSAGVLRQFDHPIVTGGITTVLAAAKRRNLPACLGIVWGIEDTRKWAALGGNFVLVCEDVSILTANVDRALAENRRAVEGR